MKKQHFLYLLHTLSYSPIPILSCLPVVSFSTIPFTCSLCLFLQHNGDPIVTLTIGKLPFPFSDINVSSRLKAYYSTGRISLWPNKNFILVKIPKTKSTKLPTSCTCSSQIVIYSPFKLFIISTLKYLSIICNYTYRRSANRYFHIRLKTSNSTSNISANMVFRHDTSNNCFIGLGI